MSEWYVRISGYFIAPLCFALLGGLTGRHVGPSAWMIVPLAMGGALLGLGGVVGLSWILGLWPSLREYDRAARKKAVATAFMTMVPFTVLALLAELVLNWNAVQSFAVAGIVLAGGAVGMELSQVKKSPPPLAAVLLSTLGAVALSLLWIGLGLLAGIAGGVR